MECETMKESDIIFLSPVFKERIWGGSTIKNMFKEGVPSGKIGEAWIISAHHHGSSKIMGGLFDGMSLDALYHSHPELFGDITESRFPLLTKILDAADQLSVQVHPSDAYAKAFEDDLGKEECWYVLAANQDSTLVLGHHAQTKTELKKMVEENRWNELLDIRPIRKGDFVYIPAGTIHAIGAGVIILETQQSSDVTYRFYDYDRMDPSTGEKRALQVQKSIDTAVIPANRVVIQHYDDDRGIYRMLETKYFTVEKWNIDKGYFKINAKNRYYLCTVLSGNAMINGSKIKMYDSFIIPSLAKSIKIEGMAELLVSYVGDR
jgi:mannose-6-phosphate isomerase